MLWSRLNMVTFNNNCSICYQTKDNLNLLPQTNHLIALRLEIVNKCVGIINL